MHSFCLHLTPFILYPSFLYVSPFFNIHQRHPFESNILPVSIPPWLNRNLEELRVFNVDSLIQSGFSVFFHDLMHYGKGLSVYKLHNNCKNNKLFSIISITSCYRLIVCISFSLSRWKTPTIDTAVAFKIHALF